jgi:hypothetical protein
MEAAQAQPELVRMCMKLLPLGIEPGVVGNANGAFAYVFSFVSYSY